MDTAYNLPFQAYLIVNPNTSAQKIDFGPWGDIQLSHEPEEDCATIKENDEMDLYFNSTDKEARLYLDALECCPSSNRIMVDDEGFVYCTPGEEVIKLYRSDSSYDALRVDVLQISVMCGLNSYFSFLKIAPKQLSLEEWKIMRDDLETEIQGLAQDIVRRNIGLGDEVKGLLPPDDLYAFLIINKNAHAIMSALLDIKDKPKYKLKKRYEEVDESKNREIDTETVKKYLQRGALNHTLLVPRRDIVYDIQENRLLKKIVKAYDEKLAHFIDVIYSTLNYRKQRLTRYPKHSLYDEKYIQGLESYLATAEKLKKITNIIKSAEWFQTVKNPEDMFIPHSFAVDSRYGSLYRMYLEMNKRNFSVQLDPQYSYSWKKSSSLYEMWCYICICRSFLQQYTEVGLRVQDIFMKDHLFPFLKSGTKILLENKDSAVEIIYDSVLPKKSEQVKLYGHPLYITGKHTRPDICINMYSKKSGWYVGSFIIECKYRSLKAFWYGNTWSSREQIKAYHNDSKSPLFFNGFLDLFTSSRPVLHVFTFTPDIFDEREYSDDQVTLLTFRPTRDRDIVEKVCERLIDEVSNAVKLADQFYIKINPNP
ncbi:DUF2357 domain-containing protein [Lawsonibacter sp. OA9]|uniref:DUF2357 domain-containing protein n=1 Tax=Lawsonibacter sp. OA9 TaxID=2914163 RepID=UPI001F06D041|nr:DUF2357 domain-containing protein [Lawsonibacter sp. OA9]MCH1978758.1 DUF2357 domain-containing protein [Lawsonibacter sp. OA9]